MPKVTEEHRTARKQEIVGAALRLFARQGFQATSMADIIAESGLSAGAIYGHYSGKDELIRTAIAELLDLKALTDETSEEGVIPPGQMMRRFLEAIEAEMGDLSLLVQVWGQAVLDPAARESTNHIVIQLQAIYREYLTRWYRDGLGLDEKAAKAAATKFAPLHVGIVQGYILQYSLYTGFDREAYFAAATELQPSPQVPGRARTPKKENS
jgi:AcrR family transcriptional regulator